MKAVSYRVSHKISQKIGGKWSEGDDAWSWIIRVRWWLSYQTGIGRYFWDGKDDCEICGGIPSDMDFCMVRIGRKRSRCDAPECLHPEKHG